MSELNKESVEQAGGDERAAFEVWASPLGWKLSPDQNNCGIVVAERYGHPGVQRCWEAWQARAALAQPSPAQAEKAEVERTEGSADLLAIVREAVAGAYNEWKMISEAVTEIMEAHERIVGELRADRDSWAEQAEQRLADWDEMRKERDAALARVAELEKQEPVAHLRASDLERLNQPGIAGSAGSLWNGPREGFVPLYAAPVAQAQHSVPDGYRLIRLEHFAAIKAQLNPEQVDAYRGRNIYDEDKVYANWNACRSALDEIKDVFQQIDWDAENELAELLAAAPGNSAQHSVPEGWMLVECGIWTQEQVDEMQKTVARFRNSEFVDDRALAMAVADAGQCKAPEISLAELLAAATGKEGL
ncbi:hypothetical protein [Pseudomonas aeruginosa]|uniref:hypothetical protein n=1 Tax=Pseudomonas aeruginosa TaxID=287 RepID=UPI001A9F70B6|nr:hypothetical protein [Pseudomonas aeruginosa]